MATCSNNRQKECICPDGFLGQYCEFTSSSSLHRFLSEGGEGNEAVQAVLFFFLMGLLFSVIISLLRLYLSIRKEAQAKLKAKRDISPELIDGINRSDSNEVNLELAKTPELI
jgi:hypothetical protein